MEEDEEDFVRISIRIHRNCFERRKTKRKTLFKKGEKIAEFLISKVDEEKVSSMLWHIFGGYVYAYIKDVATAKSRRVFLHRFIMEASPGQFIDHINGNKLDNRRENLRFCTIQENGFNRGKPKNNTTGFKGVFYTPKGFRAIVKYKSKGIYIQCYPKVSHEASP